RPTPPAPASPPPADVGGGTLGAPTTATLAPAPGAALAKVAPAPAPADPPPAPAVAAPGAAPPAAATPSVLPFGPEMSRPVLLSGGDLLPPREANVAGVSGTVIARFTIVVDGDVRNCRMIKGHAYPNSTT